MTQSNRVPERPFGVTLAIVASVLVYSILPLLWVGTIMLIEQRLNSISEISIPVGSEEIAPVASGGNLDLGAGTEELVIQAALSLGFLLIAVFAWRGRSTVMRYIFLVVVVSLSILMIAIRTLPLLNSDAAGESGGSLDTLFDLLSDSHVVMLVIVPIYVVWYLNRGPARAFYRGAYLNEEDAEPA